MEVRTSHLSLKSRFLSCLFWAGLLNSIITALGAEDQRFFREKPLLLVLYLTLPKITADGDCSHEIKRRLLLGRKVMTNLDSILKSRDFTLPTKVHLVKAMIFPVVMYGCES